MNIKVQKIKSSPYKLVLSKDKIVGLLEYGRFIHRDSFTPRHKEELKKHIRGTNV